MNEPLPFERMVAGWMADEAAGAPDEVLGRILATTSATRPRPRWWAQLAERPMRTRTTRAAVGMPNRGLVLAAILALLLVAIAGAAVGAWLVLRPPPPIETGDWSGFRGNADRSGVGVRGPAGSPVLNWQFHAGGIVLEVAIVGDRAYFASDDGTLQAVSRDRGILQWTRTVPNNPPSGPYAGDGRLYLSDATGVLHAYSQADGTPVWTSTIEYVTPSRLIEADGMLYLGTSDGFLVAVDAATGAERWRIQPPGATQVDAPAFGTGLVIAGTNGAGLVAVDPATRQVVWSGDTNGEDTGSAAIVEGIAYIGVSAIATSGTLHAFDLTTGRPLWTTEDALVSLPTVDHGVAYASTNDGRVVAIDTATGATRWRIQLNGEVRAPVVAGGVVYVFAGSEHRVYAIDGSTGGRLWQFDLSAYGNCCIAVAKGAVFVGLQDGSVFSIGGDGAQIAAVPFPSVGPSAAPTPSPSPSAGPTPTPLPSIATVTWTTDLRDHGFAPISQIAVDPRGRIWAPEPDADRIAIFGPDGKLLEEWAAPADAAGPFDFTRGNGDAYGTLAFAKDGSFYVLDVGNRRVQVFDRNRKFVRAWGAFGTRPGEYTDPVGIGVAPDGSVWVLDDIRQVVEHYARDGKVLGSFDPFQHAPVNNGANSLAIDPHGNLYVSVVSPSKVLVFDPTGRFLRAVGEGAFAEQASHMAIDGDGRIFVTQGPERGAAPGVLVFGADGTLLGGFGPEGAGDGQLEFTAGIALDGSGGLYVEDSLPETARLMRVELRPPAVP